MKTKMQKVCDFVNEADLVLVGIGEEFERKKILEKDEEYCNLQEQIRQAEAMWVMPYVNTYWLRERMQDKVMGALQGLKEILEGKNYFIVSTAMNGFLKETGFKEDRVVEPCGTYEKLQCENGCSESLELTDDFFVEQIRRCCLGMQSWKQLQTRVCSQCGAKKVFNNLYVNEYIEQGYLEDWSRYMKWLQGTLNRRVCILELGEGLRYPSVIRWPFEKTAFLNKKAVFVRIHERLYQLTQEIGEQGYSVAENAVDFLT